MVLLSKCGRATLNNWNEVVLVLFSKNGDKLICSNNKDIRLISSMKALPSSSSYNYGQRETSAPALTKVT